MINNSREHDLIRGINENMNFVRSIPIEDAGKCAGSIRSVLEYAVKLFWLKKYGKEPVGIKKDHVDLYQAITDKRFSQYFSKMTISYMHIIRQIGNGVLHSNDSLTLDEAKELLAMLEKCVKAIENAIPMEIITPSKIIANVDAGQKVVTDDMERNNSPSTTEQKKALNGFRDYLIRCGYAEYTSSGLPSSAHDYVGRIQKVLEWESMSLAELNQNIDSICREYDIGGIKQELGQKSHGSVINALKRYREYLSAPVSSKTDTGNPERTVFWQMLQEELDRNGNPFTISTRAQYGTVNRKRANCSLCLGFDFLLQKRFFRIGIYIQDDTKTPHFNRLLRQKDEIESFLGFKPIWTTRGERNPHTRRIQTQLPFTPYDRDDYERLIEEALPIFMQYIKMASKYLPEVFCD